jgi:hypothetical protein
MSQVKIRRLSRSVSATIATSTSSSTTLRLDDMATAAVQLPTVGTSGTIQVWGNTTDTGTFVQAYGADGVAATITVPAGATANGTVYAMPAAAASLPYVKLVAAAAGVTASATVLFKS